MNKTRVNSIRIEVALSPAPRQTWQWCMELPAGTTVGQAREAALQCWAQHNDSHDNPDGHDIAWQAWGIWGRQSADNTVLQEGDRLEAYRPLRVDPKTARRERFARQGARGAGLFANRRKGSKPGY